MNTEKLSPDDYQEIYFHKERHEMLHFVPQTAKVVLDVGCASGSFGCLLKAERAIEIWGVEVNQYAATIAEQNLDKVLCGAFDKDLKLPKHHFDCIVFNDVLEHLVDPYSALSYCKELLSHDGTIVASIPNVRYFDNIWKLIVDKDWQYSDYGILDRTHLRFFTKKSIISTFKELGYQIQHLEGINSLEKEHPYRVRKFQILNRLFLNQIEDMRYLQYAVVANPAPDC